MCGIVGVMQLRPGREPVRPEVLGRMRDTLAHRGPDGAGLWISPDGRVGLGHRRLAIIDTAAAANQPMSNEDGSVQIVFNGEIYNHAELRPELERAGHRFVTDHSDTEVLVHGYEQWGEALLQRLRGMFAFAIWDARARSLWLVRDRIGIKPLYFTRGRRTPAVRLRDQGVARRFRGRPTNRRRIACSTTCRSSPLRRRVRSSKVSTSSPPAARSACRSTGRCPSHGAGGSLGITWSRWSASPRPRSRSACSAKLREAVRYRKVSDVPVGVFLSGGIDSSTNTALFAEGERSPVNTFSIGYEGEHQSYKNELEYAARVAQRFGTLHHERRLEPDDLLDFLPRMIHHQDEPLGDPVCVPLYYVSELARGSGVIVCQVGEGADELFWGYPGWKQNRTAQRLDDLPVPRALKRLAAAGLAHTRYRDHAYAEWMRRGGAGEPMFWSGSEAFGQEAKMRLLADPLRRRFRGTTSFESLLPIRRRYEEKAWERAPLQWMTFMDLNLRLPELLLMRVDKMSMAVALEARVPFLDHEMVELALSIPESVKTANGELKGVLRRAVRGLIPDFVLDRPKQGFGVPLSEWLLDRVGDDARDELSHFCRASGLLDQAEVLRVLATRHGHHVFPLLNLALWWRRIFGDGRGLAGAVEPAAASSQPAASRSSSSTT